MLDKNNNSYPVSLYKLNDSFLSKTSCMLTMDILITSHSHSA